MNQNLRTVMISAAAAFLLLLPLLNAYEDWGWQSFYGIGILATGLDYMRIFFHELGHTITAWLFGIPALPSFDFQHGGGMTYSFEPQKILLVVVYGGFIAAAFWLWQNAYYVPAIGVAVLALVHALLLFMGAESTVITFMGHGFETLVASALLLLALMGVQLKGPIDRYLNITFAFYVYAQNILSSRMMFSDIGRMAYAEQKGGHIAGDFEKLADAWNISIQSVAGIYIALNIFAFCAVIVAYFWLRPSPENP